MRLPTLALVVLATLAAQPAPPRDACRAFEKATAAAQAKRLDEAVRDYQQAVTLCPAYAEAWYELGRLQLERKQPDQARSAFDAAIHADPKYAAPYLMLATLENSGAHWNQLVDVTGRLLQFDAIDYPQAWLLNAVGHYNNRNPETAEKSAREAERLDLRRQFPGAWRLLGQILAQRGDFAGAADQFREYLKVAPSAADSETVRAKLADAEKRLGNEAGPANTPTFVSDTDLAVVRFQFHGSRGEPPRELTRNDIEIREDGVVRPLALFGGPHVNPNAVPVEISLLFDCSASVDQIGALTPNVFRENLLDQFPNVSIAIYGFSDSLVRFARPTRDAGTLKKAMDRVVSIPKADTPLFGSIADTVRDAGATGAGVVRMLVVFSDGESSSPGDEVRAEEAAGAAAKSGTALFPVILDKPAAAQSIGSQESVSEFLKLAAPTGGKVLPGFMGTDVLPSILQAVAHEIQDDYVAGFYLFPDGKAKAHRIQVVLRSGVRGTLYGGARSIVY